MVNTTKAPMEGALVIYYKCYRPILVTERGCIKMFEILISFTISIVAGITCHYICKWLDIRPVTSAKKGGVPPSSFVLRALKCLQNTYFFI